MSATARWRRVAVVALLAGLTATPRAAPADCDADTPLAAVKGLDRTAVPPGTPVRVAGVVSAAFPGGSGLNGFFLQSEEQGGGPPIGVFVYTPEHGADELPRRGARVAVTGRTGRHAGAVQLEWVEAIEHCGRSKPRAVVLDPPVDRKRLRRLAGVLVTTRLSMTVADAGQLARWGVLRLAVGGRPFHSATGIAGGRDAGLLLDDGSYRRWPSPVPYRNAAGTRRAGSRVEPFRGVLTRAFGAWRIHPVSRPDFVEANPRRAAPDPDGTVLRLASLNLRNFFTVTDARGPSDGPARARAVEAKVAALAALDADVLALQEVENHPGAVRALIDRLADAGGGRFAAAVGALRPGGDAIRNVLLYRRDRLEVVAVDRLDDAVHDRPPLRAVLRAPDGLVVDVVGVHFKSKGGCRQATAGPEGCGAARRRAQARSLAAWLAIGDAVPTFVLGDFNSYAREGPMRGLVDSGLTDLLARDVVPRRRYTYVYRGRAGALDHVLADPEGAAVRARARVWHMGADEPRGVPASGPWGASDHDAVILDLAVP